MSTYHQSSVTDQFWSNGSGRPRGPRSGGRFTRRPQDTLRRRLAALLVIGLCIAPIAWALRGDGNAVDVTETGGAAAIVQFDTNSDSSSISTAAVDSSSVVPNETTPEVAEAAVIPAVIPAETPAEIPVTAAPTTQPAPRVCAAKYTVQAGDSWFGIAERSGVKASLIAGTNDMTIRSALMVGQEICLPPGAVVPAVIVPGAVTTTTTPKIACVGSYTVKTGDSWSGIASKNGIKISALTAANGKTSRSTLLPGQKLCLPQGVVVAAEMSATTSAPTTTQPPKYVPTRTFTGAELEKFVRDAWPDELEADAFYVVQRESNWNPLSRNSCCIGLFQLNWNSHKSWMKNYGITDASELLNPEINAKLAYATWQRSGSWQPWCTRNWCPGR